MSTKSPLAQGKTYSLYEEIYDRETIWLQLDGVAFEATHRGITSGIPLDVWEIIRRHTFAKYDLVGRSDRELCKLAAQRVDERLERYKKTHGFLKKLMQAKGVNDSRTAQIRVFMREFRSDRAWQEDLAQKTGFPKRADAKTATKSNIL